MSENPHSFSLRALSLPVRLVLACYLLSVAVGYCSALVQLHFHVASAGKALPDLEDNILTYHGTASQSQLERLLMADLGKPFNGSGSMRAAFTTKSAGWNLVTSGQGQNNHAAKAGLSLMEIMLEADEHKPLTLGDDASSEAFLKHLKEVDDRKLFNGDPGLGTMRPAFLTRSGGWRSATRKKPVEVLRQLWAEREGERLVLLDWIRTGLDKNAFEKDQYPLKGPLAKQVITPEFVEKGEKDQLVAKIQSLVGERCTRCHKTNATGSAGRYPLETYEEFALYCEKDPPPANPPGKEDDPAKVLAEREGERLALLAWIRAGAPKEAYVEDRYPLQGELGKHPLTPSFVMTAGKEKQRFARIQSILEARCVRCHVAEAGGAGAQYPLDSYDLVKAYCGRENSGGMSLPKLAQTTHIHLLGFAVLYAFTGVIFAFSSYHWGLRLLLSPWPLVWQVIDIAGWWLTRGDPQFARLIIVCGGLAAIGLVAQIVLSLLNMFDKKGKVVVILLLLAGAVGLGLLRMNVIEPYLANERNSGSLQSHQ